MRTPTASSHEFAAVLLAGGRSRRMGFDKTRILVHGRPVIHVLADRLLEVTGEVFVSSNDPGIDIGPGIPRITVIPDIHAGCGPLSGIHAAFYASTCRRLIVLACDIPAITSSFLRRMAQASLGFDVLMPMTCDGRFHPTCAVYDRNCLPYIERYLAESRYRALQILDEPGLLIRRWGATEGHFSDEDLMDVNSPEDYLRFQLRFNS